MQVQASPVGEGDNVELPQRIDEWRHVAKEPINVHPSPVRVVSQQVAEYST